MDGSREALHRVFLIGRFDESEQGHKGLHTVDTVLASCQVIRLALVQDKLVGNRLLHLDR